MPSENKILQIYADTAKLKSYGGLELDSNFEI